VAAADAQPYRAARLGGAAQAQRKALGVPLPQNQLAGHAQALQAMQANLGEKEFAAYWATGEALALEESVAEALADEARP
jgi:hypothetical protein